MGKLIFTAALLALLCSCKKKHTCNCKVKQNTGFTSQNVSYPVTTPKMTKKEARAYCESMTVSNSGGSVQQDVTCVLD